MAPQVEAFPKKLLGNPKAMIKRKNLINFLKHAGKEIKEFSVHVLIAANIPQVAQLVIDNEHATPYQKAMASETLRIKKLSKSKKSNILRGKFIPEYHDNTIACNRWTSRRTECKKKVKITYLRGWCGLCKGVPFAYNTLDLVLNPNGSIPLGEQEITGWSREINDARLSTMGRYILPLMNSPHLKQLASPSVKNALPISNHKTFNEELSKIINLVERYNLGGLVSSNSDIAKLYRGESWLDVPMLISDKTQSEIENSCKVLISNKAAWSSNSRYSVINWGLSADIPEGKMISIPTEYGQLLDAGYEIKEATASSIEDEPHSHHSTLIWGSGNEKATNPDSADKIFRDEKYLSRSSYRYMYEGIKKDDEHAKAASTLQHATPIEVIREEMASHGIWENNGHVNFKEKQKGDISIRLPAQQAREIVDESMDMLKAVYDDGLDEISNTVRSTLGITISPNSQKINLHILCRAIGVQSSKGYNLQENIFSYGMNDKAYSDGNSYNLHGAVGKPKSENEKSKDRDFAAMNFATIIDTESLSIACDIAKDINSPLIDVAIAGEDYIYFDCAPVEHKSVGFLLGGKKLRKVENGLFYEDKRINGQSYRPA